MRVITPTPTSPSDQQEAELAEYVFRLRRSPSGWRAVHVHLSRLQTNYRYRNHLAIAAVSFDSLLRKCEGRAFRLRNNDLVAVAKGATQAELDEVVTKMRYLFSDDPLILGSADSGARFCTWYDLERDFTAFRSVTQDFVKVQGKTRSKGSDEDDAAPSTDSQSVPPPAPHSKSAPESVPVPPAAPDAARKTIVPLDATRLSILERGMAKVNLTSLIRRQPIGAIIANKPPMAIYNEIYVSMADLRQEVMPNVDLTANRWLFQYFTEMLDRGVLRVLPDMEGSTATAISVNINVSTLLSPQFQVFHEQFRQKTSKVIVFELQLMDVYSDIGSYLFARDFAHERGYRVCLDGLSPLVFPCIARDRLGFDLEKIVWAPNIERDVPEAQREFLRASIIAAGPSRVILCRCDNEAAIKFGQSVGITLFQGRYVDKLLANAGGAGR
jgi:hypothetical protein